MKSNFNYDKGAEYVFGFTDQFDVECWEFKNNTSDACNFLGPVPEIWVDDFEARYPEETTEIGRFKEMHDWVVSTKDNLDKFKMEFEDHFDMHFSLIYYVYTFFALMVDQRAKNMFLTYWGETGKWAPWFYDNDTSYGINNEGQLVLDYFHEDTDKLEGANVYNGQNSVLWCNFRDAFPDEIKATYQDLRSNSILNYDELVDQFITKGSDKWSESIYNEDADFKYISMLETDGDASNLSQVRGTGEEHFRYFIENRLNYCDGKWYAKDYADDYVALRIYTPETWAGVEPNADITVTPFSHMYAGVRYKANGTLYQKRVAANEETTFEAPDETFNDTETAIYGASQLSSLGDLSPLYCGSINVSKATKLTELIIGSDVEGYSNPNLLDLSVGTNYLLKVLNVRNCNKLTDPLALSGCPNIEEIYASGSAITGVELADSGYLKTIELPATIVNLSLKNQLYIEELTFEGYDNIKTINIENCPTVASLDILGNATNVERVRLTKVDWEYDTAAELLALADRDLAGIDENGVNTDKMWIDGKCHIDSLTGAEYLTIKEAFPYITITYDSLTAVLTFKSEDGSEDLGNQTIQNGGDGNYTGTTPTKESTAQYNFTFGGWSLKPGGDPDPDALKNVEADRIVYAAFNKELRSYTVKFYNATTLLESQTVPYGSDAVYSGSTPVHPTEPDYMEFTGWKPEPTNIQGDTDCYAQYYDNREITDDWATIAAACLDGTATDTDKYAIGAYKNVDINYEDGTSETIPFEVIGHNHDELADEYKWETAGELPHMFYRGSCVNLNEEIHILGSDYGTHSKKHYKYDGSSWTSVSTLPYSFDYGSAVVYNNEIHILGCSDADTSHYKWNGTEWVSVSTLPYNFYRGIAVVFNNEIHIMGSAHTSYRLVHYKWDGSAWTSVGAPPYGVQDTAAVVLNNEIHILGSYMNGSRAAHYKYDGSAWTSVSTLPYDFYNGSAVVLNNQIHILGTNSTVEGRTNHYKWNGTNWSEETALPFGLYDGCALAYNGKVTIVGSYAPGYNKKFVQLAGASWESVSTLPYNFYHTESIVYNNEIHIIGGAQALYSHYKWDGNEWTSVSTLPYNFKKGCVCVFNNEIHILGGYMSKTAHYKWTGSEWVAVSTLLKDFYDGSAVVYNNEIHILGGRGTDHYKWNETDGWISVSTLPAKFYCGSAVIYKGEIHILGGDQMITNHYKYDVANSEWVSVSTLPYRYTTGAKVVMEDGIHILGGYSDERLRYHFRWDGGDWILLGDLPYDYKWSNTAVNYRNHIHILGSEVWADGKCHYALSNPRATLTFLAGNLLSENIKINGNENSNIGGWKASKLREYLNGDFVSTLPSDLQTVITEVKKLSDSGSGNTTLVSTNDKAWIPSFDEVIGGSRSNVLNGQGEIYPVFTNNESRIRRYSNGDAAMYILRTANTVSIAQWMTVSPNGSCWFGNANGTYAILFGFCIK